MSRLARLFFFFFQAEDGIRDLVRSRGLGDVYKRQGLTYQWKKFSNNINGAASLSYVAKTASTYKVVVLSLIHI